MALGLRPWIGTGGYELPRLGSIPSASAKEAMRIGEQAGC